MMQASYKSVLDLTDDGLAASEKGFLRLMDAMHLMDDLKVSATSSFPILEWKQRCYDAMNDDFNTPILIATLFEAVKFINQIKDGNATVSKDHLLVLKQSMETFVFDILGLVSALNDSFNTEKLSGAVAILINLRKEARLNKDFALSDKIRDELAEAGIQLQDGKEGTTFSTN